MKGIRLFLIRNLRLYCPRFLGIVRKVKGKVDSLLNILRRSVDVFAVRQLIETLKISVPVKRWRTISVDINIGSPISTLEESFIYEGEICYDLIVVCGAYPGGRREYGGEFIYSRVEAYRQSGYRVMVLELSKLNTDLVVGGGSDIECLRLPENLLEIDLEFLDSIALPIFVHSAWPKLISDLVRSVDHRRLNLWFHGFEVRDYRRLYFNFTTSEQESLKSILDTVNLNRAKAAQEVFPNANIKKIFVSNFLKHVAEEDMGAKVVNFRIIHNFIDTDFYKIERSNVLPVVGGKRVLLIRSFGNMNYANDIAINAIEFLTKEGKVDSHHFTICGFGRYFDSTTQRISNYDNVDLVNRPLSSEEMKSYFSLNDIFLAPTRFDTQGVTLGEAMSSGLLCITSRCTAIPEFVNDECALLANDNDPEDYSRKLSRALDMSLPEVRAMGLRARQQVISKCSKDKTIRQELSLIDPKGGE